MLYIQGISYMNIQNQVSSDLNQKSSQVSEFDAYAVSKTNYKLLTV